MKSGMIGVQLKLYIIKIMKQNKNFLNALDDWGSILTDTYEDAIITHKVIPLKDKNGKLYVPMYYIDQVPDMNLVSSVVSIPEGVEKIEHGAFINCKDMTHIAIPDTVNEICDFAFNNCVKLQEISLPDNIEHIQLYTFLNCKSLKKVKFPSNLKVINHSAFSDCDLQGKLIFPNSTRTIGDNAFKRNKNLLSLLLNDGLEHIASWAFSDCTSLTGELVIPESVDYMGKFVFINTKLSVIHVPKHKEHNWHRDWHKGCTAKIVYY